MSSEGVVIKEKGPNEATKEGPNDMGEGANEGEPA